MDNVHDLFFWLVLPCLVLLVSAALAATLCWRQSRVWPLQAAAWLLCAPTLVTLLILVCGTLFAADVATADAPAARYVVGLFVLDLMGIACLAWWFRRFRMVVLPLAMAQAWLACLAAANSYMSVTCGWP